MSVTPKKNNLQLFDFYETKIFRRKRDIKKCAVSTFYAVILTIYSFKDRLRGIYDLPSFRREWRFSAKPSAFFTLVHSTDLPEIIYPPGDGKRWTCGYFRCGNGASKIACLVQNRFSANILMADSSQISLEDAVLLSYQKSRRKE